MPACRENSGAIPRDRGLYKTVDGGKTGPLVLKGSNLSTGCGSVAIDPSNPDVLLAGLWDFRRQGWTFRSGGNGPKAISGSGLYRSTDAGRTWSEIAPSQHGMPPKPYGRIALAYAPSDAKTVYAFVESTESKLLISHDGGTNWDSGDKSSVDGVASLLLREPDRRSEECRARVQDRRRPDSQRRRRQELQRPSAASSACTATCTMCSSIPTIHNTYSQRDDGGLWISFDGANKWWKTDNLPISQFYHVSLDKADPYHVYGGLQDNSRLGRPVGLSQRDHELPVGEHVRWRRFLDVCRSHRQRLPVR